MVTATKSTHIHKFELVRDIGTCRCGERRQYICNGNPKENHFKVLSAGVADYQDDSGHTDLLAKSPAAPVKTPESVKPTNKPGKGGGGYNQKRHLYYLAHKAEIIADIEKLGLKPALTKWGIKASTWGGKNGLAVQWGHSSKDTVKPRKPKAEKSQKQTEKPIQPTELKETPETYQERQDNKWISIGVNMTTRLFEYWSKERDWEAESSFDGFKLAMNQTIDFLGACLNKERGK